MTTSDSDLFTRSEILAGLPARRAKATRFLYESLPAVAEVRCGDAIRSIDRRLADGQAVLPLAGPNCRVTLRLDTVGGH